MLIAHTYPNANSYTDSHGNRDVDSDDYINTNGNGNSDRDAYPKTFTHPSASSDAATSPIAGKQVVTNVKWLGAREKSREFLS